MPLPSDENDLLQSFVQKGCEFFGFEFGIISSIKDGQYHVLAAIAEIPFFKVDDSFELKDTFCMEIIKTGSTVSYNQVSDIGHLRKHPAYRNMRLESYIGTPIKIDGKIVGTVNFASLVAREIDFPQDEVHYIESVAETLASECAEAF